MYAESSSVNVTTLDCLGLAEYLISLGVDGRIISTLKAQDIDGECFCLLTEVETKDLGLSIGQTMKLKKVIEKVRQAAQSSPPAKRSCDVLDCVGLDSAAVINTATVLDCVGLDSAAVINTGTIPSLHSNTVETGNQISAQASTSAVNASSSSEDGFHFTGEVIKSLLNVTENGKVILGRSCDAAKNSAVLLDEHRHEVNRICVAKLVEVHGMYPNDSQKEELAKAIVSAIPSLALDDSLPGNPWSLFYDRQDRSSYITVRLRHMRKYLKPEESARRKPKNGAEGNVDADRPSGGKKRKTKHDEDFLILPENVLEDLKFKVNWLKSHPSSPGNAATIRDFMTKTFGYRRHLLATTLTTATLIIQHFPRFVDLQYGSLIWADFLLKHPEVERSFQKDFIEEYFHRLVAHANTLEKDIQCSNDGVKALMLLLSTHPRMSSLRKISAAQLMERFIVFRDENIDLEDFASVSKPVYLKQPFLVCVGSVANPGPFYLIIDHTVIPCGEDIDVAFRNLYASFYTFHVDYPFHIKMFYAFFDEIVFRVHSKKEISTTNRNFANVLQKTVPRTHGRATAHDEGSGSEI